MALPVETTIRGLSDEEVRRLTAEGKVNVSCESPSKSVKQIIFSNIFTYFNLIFIIIGTALIAVGSKWTELTFLAVITINAIIGIVQELRSKKTLEKLSLLTTPNAFVMRSGVKRKVAVDELVLGDIVVLGAGSQICADAKVISGEVSVNEALVTGESDEIQKNVGADLLSGSFVVSGSCYAQLTAVGADSYVSRLSADAKKMKGKSKGAMMRSLSRLVLVIGIIIIPIAFFMIMGSIRSGNTLKTAVSTTAGALVGMIPEGLYLLTSVALAVGVMRLARKKTLVHELSCIETLARVDTLCVDKTGTITEPEMKVTGVVSLNSSFSEYDLDGMIGDFVGSIDPDNDTMRALHDYFARDNSRHASAVIPFSSRYKYSAVSFSDGTSFVIGAPEFILGPRFGEFKSRITKLASDGSRVLLFARTQYSPKPGELVPSQVEVLGAVTLLNAIRENAKETFEYFNEQGVDIKVISGDAPATVSAAANAAGIRNAYNAVDLSTLPDDNAVREAATQYTVFGRVTPDRKRTLVQALKAAGKTVAMTGDGVNDVLALKEADCSIAMASGSDAASHVSNLVLLNSDFSSLPSVVDEGRRVINNIERSASLYLVKNIFSILFAVISIFAIFTYPITPANLTLVNWTTIGIPSFFLALEPNKSLIKGKFLPNALYRALPAAVCDLFVLIGTVLFQIAFKLPSDEIGTICEILIGFVGMLMLYFVCRPFNTLRRIIMVAMPTIFIFGICTFPDIFKIVPLHMGSALILVVFLMLAVPVIFASRWLFEKAVFAYKRILKRSEKDYIETSEK